MNPHDDTAPADRSPGESVSDAWGEAIPRARPVGVPRARRALPANPLLLTDISTGRAAIHLLILLGVFGLIIVALLITQFLLEGREIFAAPDEIDAGKAMSLTLGGGLVLIIAAVAIVSLGGGSPQSIGLCRKSWGLNVVLGPVVAFVSYGSFLLCAGMIWLVWPAGFEQLSENPERIKEMMPDVGMGALFLMMLGIGVYEEIIFRGFLLTHLRRVTRSWTAAIVISGLVFAALHVGEEPGTQTLATAIPLFAVAVVWSLVTIWRKSLLPSIIGHTLFNAVQIVVLQYYT